MIAPPRRTRHFSFVVFAATAVVLVLCVVALAHVLAGATDVLRNLP